MEKGATHPLRAHKGSGVCIELLGAGSLPIKMRLTNRTGTVIF
jgi:hypothetical protein